MSPCGICGKETGAAASSFCQSCKAIFSGSSGVSQKSLAVILGALLSGSQKTVGMYEDEDEDDYYDQPKAQGIKDRIDNLKERRDRVLTQKHQGLSNIQCKILGPFFTHFKADVKAGAGVPMERTKSAEAAGLEKGHLSFRDMKRLSSRCFRIARDLLAEPGFGKDVGATSYLSHILKGINDAAGDEVVAAIHSDGDGHCLVHAVSRCLAGQEFFWHALRTDLWWRLKTDRHLYLENLPKPLRELYSDENFREWSEIVAEADPKYVPPAGAMLGLQPVHLFGLANILRRPIVLFDGLNGGECGVYLPTLTAPENTSTKKLLAIAWANSARNHFCAVVPIEGQRCLIPKRLLPQNENGVIVWGDEDDSRLAFYVDLVPSGREGDEELYVEVGPGSDEKAASFDAAVRIMEKEFKRKYGFPTNYVSEVFASFDQMGCAILNQENSENLCGSIKTNVALNYCPVCAVSVATKRDIPAVCDCGNDVLRPFDMETGTFKLNNGDRVRTETPIGYGCCGFKHYFDGKEYDVCPTPIEVVGLTMLLKLGNSDPNLNTTDKEIETFCHECAVKACGGNPYHESYDEKFKLVQDTVNKDRKLIEAQIRQKLKQRDQTMAEAPLPKPVPSSTPSLSTSSSPPKKHAGNSAVESESKRRLVTPMSPPSTTVSPGLALAPKMAPAPVTPAVTTAPSRPLPSKAGQIRFSFPDGTTDCSEFHSNDLVLRLFEYVCGKLQTEISSVALSGGWPPKPLSPTDDRTLAGAQLLDSKITVTLVGKSAATVPRPTQTESPIDVTQIGAGRSVIRNGVLIRAQASEETAESTPLKDENYVVGGSEMHYGSAADQMRRSALRGQQQTNQKIFGFDSLRGAASSAKMEPVGPSLLVRGGRLYEIARREHGLAKGLVYHFPEIEGKIFVYDPIRDCLKIRDEADLDPLESLHDQMMRSIAQALERQHGPLVHGRTYKFSDQDFIWNKFFDRLVPTDTPNSLFPSAFQRNIDRIGSTNFGAPSSPSSDDLFSPSGRNSPFGNSSTSTGTDDLFAPSARNNLYGNFTSSFRRGFLPPPDSPDSAQDPLLDFPKPDETIKK